MDVSLVEISDCLQRYFDTTVIWTHQNILGTDLRIVLHGTEVFCVPKGDILRFRSCLLRFFRYEYSSISECFELLDIALVSLWLWFCRFSSILKIINLICSEMSRIFTMETYFLLSKMNKIRNATVSFTPVP